MIKIKNKYLFEILIIILLIFISIFFAKFEAWNTNNRIDLTRAIVDQHTFKINDYVNNTGDRAAINGNYYSEKSPGTSFLLTPIYAIYKTVFGKLKPASPPLCTQNDSFCYENYKEYYYFSILAIIWISALPIAGIIIILYYLTKKRTKNKYIYYGIPLLALITTILLGSAKQLNNNMIGAFLLITTYYLLFETKKSKKKLIWTCIILIATPMISIISTTMLIPLLLFYLITKKDKKKYIYILSFFLGILLLLAYNYNISGEINVTLYKHIDKDIFGQQSLIKNEYTLRNTLISEYEQLYKHDKYGSISIMHIFPQEKRKYYYEFNPNSTSKNLFTHGGILFYDKIHQKLNIKNESQTVYNYSIIRNNQSIQIQENGTTILTITQKNKIITIKNNFKKEIITTNCPQSSILFLTKENKTKICYIKKTLPTGLWKTYYIKYSQTTIKNDKKTFFKQSSNKEYTIIEQKILFEYSNSWRESTGKLIQILFLPYNGFFFFNPILLVGLYLLIRKIKKNKIYKIILLSFIINIIICLKSKIWWGGTTFGPRFMIASIPLLLIPIINEYKNKSKKTNKIKIKTVLVTILILAGLFINFFGLLYFVQNSTQTTESGKISYQFEENKIFATEYFINTNSINTFVTNLKRNEKHDGILIKNKTIIIILAFCVYLFSILIYIINIKNDNGKHNYS